MIFNTRCHGVSFSEIRFPPQITALSTVLPQQKKKKSFHRELELVLEAFWPKNL